MAIATILLAGMGTARLRGKTKKTIETPKKNLPDDDSAQKTTSHEQPKYLPTVIYSPAVTVTDNDLGLAGLFAEGNQDINHKFYKDIFYSIAKGLRKYSDKNKIKKLTIEEWQTFQEEIDSNQIMQHAMEYAPKLYQNWHETIKIRAHKISQQLIDQKLQEITHLLDPYVNDTNQSIEDWDNQKGIIKSHMHAVNLIIDEGSNEQKANNRQAEEKFLLIDQIFEERREKEEKRREIDDVLSECDKNIKNYEAEKKDTTKDQLTDWSYYRKNIIQTIEQLEQKNIKIKSDGSTDQKKRYDTLQNNLLPHDNKFLDNIDAYIPDIIGDGENLDSDLSYKGWEARKKFLNLVNCIFVTSNLRKYGNEEQQKNAQKTFDKSNKVDVFFEKKMKEAEEQLALCNKTLEEIKTLAEIEDLEELCNETDKKYEILNKIKKAFNIKKEAFNIKKLQELNKNYWALRKNCTQLKGHNKLTTDFTICLEKTKSIIFEESIFNKISNIN